LPITVLVTTAQHEEEDDKNDNGKQNGAGLAGDLLDPLIAGAGEVAEHREADRPNETTGGVEGEKPRIAHASRPGQAGHHRAEGCEALAGYQLALGCKSIRRNNCAFAATTRVEALIRMAPTAGASKTPTPARTPAASGTAIKL
jgi:hypothetical protein